MSSSSTNKKITFKSNDGQSFEVDAAVALESQTIKQVMDDGIDDKEIPIPEVTGRILAKIIEYCKKHVEAATARARASYHENLSENGRKTEEECKAENDLMVWDSEFVNVEFVKLFELIRASNYLEIENLYLLGCRTVADMMRGKSTEELRKMLNIENDFTPEEEAQVRRENVWAFE